MEGFKGADCDEVVCPGPYCEEEEEAGDGDGAEAAGCMKGFTGADCDEAVCPGPYCEEEEEAAGVEVEVDAGGDAMPPAEDCPFAEEFGRFNRFFQGGFADDALAVLNKLAWHSDYANVWEAARKAIADEQEGWRIRDTVPSREGLPQIYAVLRAAVKKCRAAAAAEARKKRGCSARLSSALWERAVNRSVAVSDHKVALDIAKQATRANPRDAVLLGAAGYVYMAQGNNNAARARRAAGAARWPL